MSVVESRHDELAAEVNDLCLWPFVSENLVAADREYLAVCYGDGLRSWTVSGGEGIAWGREMSAAVDIGVGEDDVGALWE